MLLGGAPSRGELPPATAGDVLAEAKSRALLAHRRGDELRSLKKWREAIAYYRSAIQLDEAFSWSHHSLGECCCQIGDWEGAVAAYRQAIALKGDFVWSHYSLGVALEHLEDWTGAADCYRQVRNLEPENKEASSRFAAVLRQLLMRSPQSTQYYQELAESLLAEGKQAAAEAAYHMALQIRPDDATVAAALSSLLPEQDSEQKYLLERSLSQIVTYRDVRSVDALRSTQLVAALLKYTHLFDADYYRGQQLAFAGMEDGALLLHYISEGSAAGYRPNPLFDDMFYRQQYLEATVFSNINPLAHYHCFGYRDGNDPHPLFSTGFYCASHADVAAAQINPLEHYLATGAKEGRVAFSPERFMHLLHQTTPETAEYLSVLNPLQTNQKITQTLGVYCSSVGNYFITEIADFVAAALSAAGHRVIRLSEQDTPPDVLDGHWVIAPHEFFCLESGGASGAQWNQSREWLSQVVMVNVEQPQTTWFSKAFHFLRYSKVIFDISVKSAAIMRSLGLPAYWLPLGALDNDSLFHAAEDLPDLRATRSLPARVQNLPDIEAPLVQRPLDIHFVGTLNERRELFFSRSARWLSQYKCFLHMPPMGMPLLAGKDQALDTASVVGISRRCKILLNVHRDDLPYFEWHRIVFQGLWQSTLVVTEPCHDIPGLIAGEHFVACPLSEMAEKVEWLLNAEDGRQQAERIRRAGYATLRAKFRASDIFANAQHLVDRTVSFRGGDS